MSYGFENQISAFCDYYILFCTFFCQGTFFGPFCKNWKFDKIKNLWLFFFGAKDDRRTTNQPETSCPSWRNSNWSPKVASRSVWWWHNVKNSSFWVAQEVQRGKIGGERWSQEWEVIHKQNRWKCWACETKGAKRSLSYCSNDGRAHCHQDPKMRGYSSPKPRWCWLLFLMSMVLSKQNSCHKAKLLISMSTKTSCDV